MIAQRKRPVTRVGPRLAGLPPEPEEISAPNPEVSLTPATEPEIPNAIPDPSKSAIKRRGQPKKYATAAKKQAAYRARLDAKRQDAERRKLVADLMKIYRRQQTHIVDDPKRRVAVDESRAGARMQERLYLDSLTQLSLAELQLALEVQKETPDTHGRLHGERSGEKKRSTGQSEMERLLAAKQHDAAGEFEDGEQDPLLAAGFRKKLEGAGPQSFEKDGDADSADVRSGSGKPTKKLTGWEKREHVAIANLLFNMVRDSNTGTVTCFCGSVFPNDDAAERHLWDQYKLGEKQLEQQKTFAKALAELEAISPPPQSVSATIKPIESDAVRHHRDIQIEMEKFRRRVSAGPFTKFMD